MQKFEKKVNKSFLRKKEVQFRKKTALDLPNLLRLHQPQEQLQACNNTKRSITITDGDQTLSTSGINIKRIDDEAEFPKVSGNSVSIMGKKQLGEVTFCLSKPGRKLKQVYIFPRMLLKLLSAPGFKIIDTLILK